MYRFCPVYSKLAEARDMSIFFLKRIRQIGFIAQPKEMIVGRCQGICWRLCPSKPSMRDVGSFQTFINSVFYNSLKNHLINEADSILQV